MTHSSGVVHAHASLTAWQEQKMKYDVKYTPFKTYGLYSKDVKFYNQLFSMVLIGGINGLSMLSGLLELLLELVSKETNFSYYSFFML